MNAIIDRLNSEQLYIVILSLIGGIVAIVAIVAFTKYMLQVFGDASAYDREKLEKDQEIRQKIVDHAIARGATLEELLALEKTTPVAPPAHEEEVNGNLAKAFARLDIPKEDIEATLLRALLLDSNRKKAIIDVISELVDEGASDDSIFAAVRGLCATPSVSVKASDPPVPAGAH